MKRKLIILAGALALVASMCFAADRAIRVNRQWPPLTVASYSVGSSATIQDLSVTLIDSYWVDGTTTQTSLRGYLEAYPYPPDQMKIVVAVLQVTNEDEQSRPFNWPLLVFTSGLWSNGIDPELARALSPDLPMDLVVAGHSSARVTLGTPIFMWNYAPNEWSSAPGEQFGITSLRYPSMVTLELGPLRQENL